MCGAGVWKSHAQGSSEHSTRKYYRTALAQNHRVITTNWGQEHKYSHENGPKLLMDNAAATMDE